MDFHLDTLLNLSNVVADSYSSILDAIVVKLQLVNARINCPNCNEYISQVHQNRSVLVRDLSILEVIDSHKSDDIIAVLKQQPLAMRERV
jgi:hypothetical protein